uniref:Uncharacterized protein n=1 Tax=Anguilla anguilla TaxID=7936 RepID=A0A0E9PX35_ANGAN
MEHDLMLFSVSETLFYGGPRWWTFYNPTTYVGNTYLG